jgi:hypothetical protein
VINNNGILTRDPRHFFPSHYHSFHNPIAFLRYKPSYYYYRGPVWSLLPWNLMKSQLNPHYLGSKVGQNHWSSFILIGATKLSGFGESRYLTWNTFHTHTITVVINCRLLF